MRIFAAICLLWKLVSSTDCPLCYASFEDEDTTFKTPCGHKFHQDCLGEWAVGYGKSTCPYCLQNLSGAKFSRFKTSVYFNGKLALAEIEDLPLNERLKNVLNIQVMYGMEDMEDMRAEVVTKLVLQGAKCDFKWGGTALMRAVFWKEFNIIMLLVGAGADLNVKDKDGKTPLMHALEWHRSDVIILLVDAGADLNVQCRSVKKTILMRAFEMDQFDVCKLLVCAGANLNLQDIFQETILMKALKNYNIEILQLVVDAGADLNVKYNINGDTALMKAFEMNQFDVFKLLIDAGADLNVKNKFGETILMKAVQNDQAEIVQLLVGAGADLDVKDDSFFDHTAFDLAKTFHMKKLAFSKSMKKRMKTRFFWMFLALPIVFFGHRYFEINFVLRYTFDVIFGEFVSHFLWIFPMQKYTKVFLYMVASFIYFKYL